MSVQSTLMTLLLPEKRTSYVLPLNKGDNVLILSPHPDDETLGCGGAIIKMLSSSITVTVVLLTDGNGGGRIKDISRVRKEEFMKARSVLGYSSFNTLDYPDGKLWAYQEELRERIHKLLIEQAPKLVLTPYLLDYASDHQITNIVLAQAINIISQLNTVVGMYEIWTPITNPNCYLDITNEYFQKRTAIECYQSQENYFGITDKADALSVFRAGLSMRKRVKHMECFKLFESREYVDMIKLWRKVQCLEEGSGIEYAIY